MLIKRPADFVIGPPERPYLLRWWIIQRNRFFNIYLHKFLRSDDDLALRTWRDLERDYGYDVADVRDYQDRIRAVTPASLVVIVASSALAEKPESLPVKPLAAKAL